MNNINHIMQEITARRMAEAARVAALTPEERLLENLQDLANNIESVASSVYEPTVDVALMLDGELQDIQDIDIDVAEDALDSIRSEVEYLRGYIEELEGYINDYEPAIEELRELLRNYVS